MDFNVDVRKKQLQSLDQYISSARDRVQSILNCLGWNGKKVVEYDSSVNCSLNASHIIRESTAVEHITKCSVKVHNYNLHEEFLSEPINDLNCSIKLDHFTKIGILSQARKAKHDFKAAWRGQEPDPMTSDRLLSTFSPDERLALYNYSIAHTTQPPVPAEFNISEIKPGENEKNLSQEMLLAKQRDAKRRRIKYKSVHTNRKNHTEVMKEVIENQMELYKEWLLNKKSAEETEIETNDVNTEHNSQSMEENYENPDNLYDSSLSKIKTEEENYNYTIPIQIGNRDVAVDRQAPTYPVENYHTDFTLSYAQRYDQIPRIYSLSTVENYHLMNTHNYVSSNIENNNSGYNYCSSGIESYENTEKQHNSGRNDYEDRPHSSSSKRSRHSSGSYNTQSNKRSELENRRDKFDKHEHKYERSRDYDRSNRRSHEKDRHYKERSSHRRDSDKYRRHSSDRERRDKHHASRRGRYD